MIVGGAVSAYIGPTLQYACLPLRRSLTHDALSAAMPRLHGLYTTTARTADRHAGSIRSHWRHAPSFQINHHSLHCQQFLAVSSTVYARLQSANDFTVSTSRRQQNNQLNVSPYTRLDGTLFARHGYVRSIDKSTTDRLLH